MPATTARQTQARARKLLSDRTPLTVGPGNAGLSPDNPILTGLGMRWVVNASSNTRSVLGRLSRVSGGYVSEPTVIRFVQVAEQQWEVSGAAGGAALGFPQSPKPDYRVPQYYELKIVIRTAGDDVTRTYYFWVGDGRLGTVVEPEDRTLTAMTAFPAFVRDIESDPPSDLKRPIPQHPEFDPGSPHDEFFDEYESSMRETLPAHPGNTFADRWQAGGTDPFYGGTAPSSILPGYVEPGVPAALSFDDLVADSFAEAWFSNDGDDVRWHRWFAGHTIPDGALVEAVPGETSNYLDPTYMPVGNPSFTDLDDSNLGVAILDGPAKLEPYSGGTVIALDGTIAVTFQVTPPVKWAAGAYSYAILFGTYASFVGGSDLGDELTTGSSNVKRLLAMNQTQVYYGSDTWDVVADGSTQVDLAEGGVAQFTLETPPSGYSVGDAPFAVQVVLFRNDPEYGVGGLLLDTRYPGETCVSNVVKLQAVETAP